MTSSIVNTENIIPIIGVDEAGRGPLFGRVYAAAVILPPELCIRGANPLLKDSKKFHSKKKIIMAADFVMSSAIAWAVSYEEPQTIDEINIRRATLRAMHSAIRQVLGKIKTMNVELRIDGNDFTPYMYFDENLGRLREIPHETVVDGDDLYPSISAASILAKVARDEYILKLCENDKSLVEKYGINKNMGYGTKQHMDGIRKYGMTDLHRKSFSVKGWSGEKKDAVSAVIIDEDDDETKN